MDSNYVKEEFASPDSHSDYDEEDDDDYPTTPSKRKRLDENTANFSYSITEESSSILSATTANTSASRSDLQKSCNFEKQDNTKKNNGMGDDNPSDDGEEESSDESLSVAPQPGTSSSSASGNNSTTNRNAEVTLSDDEDDDNAENPNDTNMSATSAEVNLFGENLGNESTSRYGLRRKQKVNYMDIENALGIDDIMSKAERQKLKKEVFDIFSLPSDKLKRYINKPELIDIYTKCKVCFMDGTDSKQIQLVHKLFEKCGGQFESMFIQSRFDPTNYKFLKTTTALGKIDYRYQNREEALKFLKFLISLRSESHLPSLHSLKLVSLTLTGEESLTDEHLTALGEMDVNFQSLELGDALWEDVKASTMERLLLKNSHCLESLIIHGGFRGENEKERILITFPKMEKLSTLCICPSYTFLSEIKNPHSKKARVITLGMSREEPYKIGIKFSSETPSLKRVVLGNLIEIDDLQFSTLRKLEEFKCGSYWNLSLRFPAEGSAKRLAESQITQLQFPDALKDPSFTVKAAKHFPNLKKVWISLPSVPVLRAFFKSFENYTPLEELYLKTQFDFESTMESCLLPNMSDVLRRNQGTEAIVRTLKEYKHFDEYVRYHNIELPVEAEDLMEGHSAGIRSLKNLKILHLEHIPRRLLIPIPDDERKWYDHNCKFMNTTFGYERYPLNYRCHKEILRLDLSEYIWKNIEIDKDYADEFYLAGFVDMPDVQIIQELGRGRSFNVDDDDEDIFTPVQRGRSSGTQVKIMPSMLLPDIKIKPEGD